MNAGVTQLVECNLAKVDVAGSNPVSRSSDLLPPQDEGGFFVFVHPMTAQNKEQLLERDLRRERFAMRSLLEFARTLTPDLGPIGILKSIQRTIMGKALITDGFAYLGNEPLPNGERQYQLVSHSGLRHFPFPETISFEELETWLFSPPEGVRTTLPVFDSEQNEIIAFLGFGRSIVSETDLTQENNYLESLSLLAGMAITNARLFEAEREKERYEAELRLAREIQLSLLPQQLPIIAGLRFDAFSHQSELVGGDYYDLIALSDTKVLAVIADVVGKGVSAAILMSNVQASLHALLPQVRSGQLSLVQLAERLNMLVTESTSAERFVTAVFLIIDTSSNTVESVICGHPRPVLVKADTGIVEITTSGMPLGILPSAIFIPHVLPFFSGDTIVLYTDGLSEAYHEHNRKMVGPSGVLSIVPTIIKEGSEGLKDRLLQSGLVVTDDLTIVIISRK